MKQQPYKRNYLLPTLIVLVLVILVISLPPIFGRDRKSKKAEAGQTEKIIIIDKDGRTSTYTPDNLPRSVMRTIEGTVAATRKDGGALGIADAILYDLDLPGLTREVTKTLSEVRISDLTAEVDRTLDEIDWEGINIEVDRTLDHLHRELSNPALKRDMRARLHEAQEELLTVADDARTDIGTAREELKAARRELAIARENDNAKASKASDYSYDAMVRQMEQQGLVSKDEGFKVEKIGDELYINGQAQPGSIYRKYEKFLNRDNVTVTGDKESTVIELK